jgi:alpha-beta hydrolase superfamily lysophospholipase
VLCAPNGVLADLRAYWTADKPQYDPEGIKIPTLVIHAEWDADLSSYMVQAYFAKSRTLVELGEGTHTIIIKKNRMQFFHEVVAFLNEANALALSE